MMIIILLLIIIFNYFVSLSLLYSILTGHYDSNGIRIKHPLWQIIVLVLTALIPVGGTIALILYMVECYEDDERLLMWNQDAYKALGDYLKNKN